jgi:hypothetical protein
MLSLLILEDFLCEALRVNAFIMGGGINTQGNVET